MRGSEFPRTFTLTNIGVVLPPYPCGYSLNHSSMESKQAKEGCNFEEEVGGGG